MCAAHTQQRVVIYINFKKILLLHADLKSVAIILIPRKSSCAMMNWQATAVTI